MTDEELKAIRDRARKATPGPWMPDDSVQPWIMQSRRQTGVYVRFYQRNGILNHVSFVAARRPQVPNGSMRPMADAQFIAHARRDIPALLAEVRRLQRQLDAQQNKRVSRRRVRL
jgi:hypothetical protein